MKAETFNRVENSQVPTMMSQMELAFCRFAAERMFKGYEGPGVCVELGPWLGGSTIKLIAGLEAANHRGPLFSLDTFTWARRLYVKQV